MTSELDFETWAALSARCVKLTARERDPVLAEAEIPPEAWAAAEARWEAEIEKDLEASALDRPKLYGALCAAELERRKASRALAEAPTFAERTLTSVPMEAAPPEDALPFCREHSPEFAAYLASTRAIAGDDGGDTALLEAPSFGGSNSTLEVPADGPRARPLPFEGADVHVGGFALEQFASLGVELMVYPERKAAILERYGLHDDGARKKVEEAWGRRLVQDAELRTRWMDLSGAYKAWLMLRR
jgi:hypothetical protein